MADSVCGYFACDIACQHCSVFGTASVRHRDYGHACIFPVRTES